ncbi:unnamed protein product [Cylicostephanus goldi]|uniref:Uncharacterized protein n=1 Tax=Cylicostephanus goldi TaxID=71465 RepID=A0A3P6SHR3_CYLGO|nr:unnamed protein product [Cylicostephanus goldi]
MALPLDVPLENNDLVFTERKFLSFTESNQIFVVQKNASTDSGLLCGHISPLEDEGSPAVLATCWVELNEHFCPCRNFGAVFRMSSTFHVELTSKVEASAPIAHCSIIERATDSIQQKYWVVYEDGETLAVYRIGQSSCKAEKVEHTEYSL